MTSSEDGPQTLIVSLFKRKLVEIRLANWCSLTEVPVVNKILQCESHDIPLEVCQMMTACNARHLRYFSLCNPFPVLDLTDLNQLDSGNIMTLSSYRSTTLECGWPRLPVDGSSLNLIIEEPLPIEQLSGNQRFHSREIVHFLRPYDVKFYGEGYKDCNYAFGTIRDTEHICCKLASEQEVRTFEDLQAHDPGSHHVATLALPSHPLPTGDYLITMPLYGDDLTELADNETHLLAGSVLLKLARQLCTAVTFLHSHNMYHLDIKPQNLVVDVDNDCDLTLIDLGWVMRGKQPCAVDGATGTYDYAPPEVRLWFEWEEVFINTGKRGPKPPLYNPRKADAWMIGNLIGILLRRLAGHDDLQVESRHEILAFAEWIMNKRPRIDVALKRLDRIATNPGVSRTPSTIDSGVEVLP